MIRPAPLSTQGVKFAGSKLKLLHEILGMTARSRPRVVFDAFSGSTRVAQAFAQSGYRVIANDLSPWSSAFLSTYLTNPHPASHYQPMIDHLNHLDGKDGWFTEHYGGDDVNRQSVGSDGLKKPWQRKNTRKLDAIRGEIDRIGASETERAVLISSLILALDSVDNTMGHHVSYLQEWSPRSYNDLRLSVPQLRHSSGEHKVLRGDIFDVVGGVVADLAYLDPPYGSSNEKMPPSRVRYASYYHLWTTVVLNDQPELFGKAKRRVDTSDTVASSPFEDFRRAADGRYVAVEAIERLLHRMQVTNIILSYSSGGRATAEQLFEVIAGVGKCLEVIKLDYRRNVMAGMRWTHEWVREAEAPNQEFLFHIVK